MGRRINEKSWVLGIYFILPKTLITSVLNNKIHVYIKKIDEVKLDWNKFIILNTNNPLYLKEYTCERIKYYKKNGWICRNMIFSNNGGIVGIIPMRFKKELNILYGKFLFQPHFSPDFVISRKNEAKIINSFIDIAFYKLGCKYLDLSIPIESNRLETIKSICKKNRIYYKIYKEAEHSLIKKRSTWKEYQKNLHASVRKDLRRTARNLSKLGEIKITNYENEEIDEKIIYEVYNIEKRSWKEAYRQRVKYPRDPDIETIWKSSKNIDLNNIPYSWRILFLELNGRKIAYVINLQFKNFSTIIKTSYDNMFRKYSPGVQIINEAVKDLYNREEIDLIDFLTNIPVSNKWSNTVLYRSRIILSPKRLLPEGIGLLTQPILGMVSPRDFIYTRSNLETKVRVTEEVSRRLK